MKRSRFSFAMLLAPLWAALLIGAHNPAPLSSQKFNTDQSEKITGLGGVDLDISWITIGGSDLQWYQDVVSGEDIPIRLNFYEDTATGIYSEGFGSGVHIGTTMPGNPAQIDTYGFWAVRWVVAAIFEYSPQCRLTLRIDEYNISGMRGGVQHIMGSSFAEPVLDEHIGQYNMVFEKGERQKFFDLSNNEVMIHQYFNIKNLDFPLASGCDEW